MAGTGLPKLQTNANAATALWDIVTGIEDTDHTLYADTIHFAAELPNPFNPKTTIGYHIPEAAPVKKI